MRLEQIIRSTMTEAADMDGRLDQLVRAGLMPTSSLPLLKRAISRMHAGMSLQGAERDVMNMFINSMMFIVLGDDTVFNKARAGAKTYATEAKEKQEYDYEGDMAMSQLKSIIANSQRMHDMLSEDTNLPEWVQSKITLAEDYLSTASNYMQGEMNEETDLEENAKIVAHLSKRYGDNIRKSHVVSAAKDFGVDASKLAKAVRKKLGKTMLDEEEQIDELSKATMGRYINKAATKMGSQGVTAGLKIAADEKSSKNFKDMGKREKGIKLAVSKLTKEDIEQVDEISKATLGSYVKKASGAEQPKNVMSPKNVPLTKIAAYQGDSETGHFGSRFNQHTYDKAERLRKNRETGIKRAVDKLTKEEVEITEASVADVAKTAHLHVRAGKHDSIHTAIQSAVNTHFPSSVHSSVTRKKVAAQALSKIQSMNNSKMTKEDAEQIDELSKRTLGSYVKKAKKELSSSDYHVGRAVGARETGQKSNFSPELERKLTKRGKKRYHGIDKAVDKMMTKEDVEQVDEISKAMAGRYVKKAAASIDLTAWRQGYKEAGAGNPSKHLEKKLSKRHKGIETAVKKLTKEDIDAVKKMNESYKTAFQTALNEYGIKSPSELDESKRKEFFNHVDLEFKKGDN
jgi:hypothetical protein